MTEYSLARSAIGCWKPTALCRAFRQSVRPDWMRQGRTKVGNPTPIPPFADTVM